MTLAPLVALALLAAAPNPRLALLSAMEQEGARSMQRLRLAGYEPPFFLSYQLKDQQHEEVSGRFGAVSDDVSRRDRRVQVDVRVGSYDLDSSSRDDVLMFLGSEGQTWSAPRDAPLDDDPQALRNALWLITDEKYKEALSSYFKKKSKGVYRADEADRAPSFTREPAQRHVDPIRRFTFDRPRWRGEVRRLTGLFRGHPDVFDASVKVTGEKQVRWFTSSEGSALVTEDTVFGVHVQAVARAVDGQLLENSRDFYARDEAKLPSPEKLEREVRALILELEALRTAPVVDPYTGPAILAPEATGVLFHEAVGHRLEGERQDDDKEGQTFKGQVGKAILPSFLSVLDDPTQQAEGEVALNGAYAYDDQGVPAQRTVLVEDGVLRTFLLSRRPVKPFARSNGHGRSQSSLPPVARMGNLVVRSKKQVPMTELKRLLIEEAKRQGKPYALIIQDITGGNTNTMSYGYQAFKGTPRLVYRVDVATGEQELVRGVELVGTPLSSVSRVVATGDDVRAFNGYCGAESGYVPVSTVAPAALVSEVELQRVAHASERSPILPAPWGEERPNAAAGAR
ncbi:MAG TPA: metallopeptidase TldD-related protein [Anaeromyxobacter sp.]|nr:metallopeptidase TldD-related protein [Anaeromyxobacter sp.]